MCNVTNVGTDTRVRSVRCRWVFQTTNEKRVRIVSVYRSVTRNLNPKELYMMRSPTCWLLPGPVGDGDARGSVGGEVEVARGCGLAMKVHARSPAVATSAASALAMKMHAALRWRQVPWLRGRRDCTQLAPGPRARLPLGLSPGLLGRQLAISTRPSTGLIVVIAILVSIRARCVVMRT